VRVRLKIDATIHRNSHQLFSNDDHSALPDDEIVTPHTYRDWRSVCTALGCFFSLSRRYETTNRVSTRREFNKNWLVQIYRVQFKTIRLRYHALNNNNFMQKEIHSVRSEIFYTTLRVEYCDATRIQFRLVFQTAVTYKFITVKTWQTSGNYQQLRAKRNIFSLFEKTNHHTQACAPHLKVWNIKFLSLYC